MPLEIIGAGFGRTGTLSLKFALEKLGFDKCYHMMEVMENPHHFDYWQRALRGEPVDWDALFEGYRATVDWPACNYWETYRERWPDAKVILSVRDPKRWYRSVRATIYPSSKAGLASEDPAARERAAWGNELIWERTFGGRLEDEEHAIAVFNAHNERVRERVPAAQLLVYDPGDGWEPLSEFLGVDAPDEPYPRVNTSEDFQQRWQAMREQAAEARRAPDGSAS